MRQQWIPGATEVGREDEIVPGFCEEYAVDNRADVARSAFSKDYLVGAETVGAIGQIEAALGSAPPEVLVRNDDRQCLLGWESPQPGGDGVGTSGGSPASPNVPLDQD